MHHTNTNYEDVYSTKLGLSVLVSQKMELITSFLCLNDCHKMAAGLFSGVAPISFIDIAGLSINFILDYI